MISRLRDRRLVRHGRGPDEGAGIAPEEGGVGVKGNSRCIRAGAFAWVRAFRTFNIAVASCRGAGSKFSEPKLQRFMPGTGTSANDGKASIAGRSVGARFFATIILPFWLAISFTASATTLDDWLKDVSEPRRFYRNRANPAQFFYSANAACVTELPANSSNSETTYAWSNPRAEWREGHGLGCVFHLVVTKTGTGELLSESDPHYGNWVTPVSICPVGKSLIDGLCIAPRQPEMGSCDKVGNPIFPGRSCKMQTEVDYQSGAGRGALSFTRQYSSWHFKDRPNRLGTNWFMSVFGRYLSFDANPTFIAVTRALADTRGWDLSGGVWVARTPTADRLENYSDGNGSAYRYYDVERHAYEFYDASGVLLRLQQLNGGDTFTLTYSTSSTATSIAPFPGLLIGITASTGAQLNLTYNSQGLLSTMQDPAGQTYAYAYGNGSADVPLGYLKSVTYPDNTTRQYKYEAANGPLNYFNIPVPPAEPLNSAQLNVLGTVANATGIPSDATHVEQYRPVPFENAMNPLTGIVDESGNRYTTWQYDSKGRPTLSTHADGAESVSLTYPTANSVQITSTLGNVNTYNYTIQSASQRVLSSISGSPCLDCGRYKNYYYNSNGLVSQTTDWNNVTTKYQYDSLGQETSRTEGYASSTPRTITTQWNSTYHLPTSISTYSSSSASGTPLRTTTFTYDSNGNQLTKTITDPATSTSRTWTHTYNSYGQVLTEDGPRTDVSDIITYSYYTCTTGYRCGQLQTIADAAGHVTTYDTYNAHGQPLTITDANGAVITLTYDPRQRLTSRTVGSETTSFAYWPAGLLKQVTLPDGSYLQYSYDAAQRLVGISDAESNHIDYTLDALGNRIAEQVFDPSNALVSTRTRVFNTLGRLWKELSAAGTPATTTTYGYDNNGNQITISAPLARNNSNTYDSLNRLKQVTDPNGGLTKYNYNANDDLISVIDPRNKTTAYTRNGLSDLIQQVSPDTGTTTSTYDSAGNLKTKTDARSKTVTYSYDALNRVTQAVWPDQTIQYGYDVGTNAIGRLTSVSDNAGQTHWTYDAHGRVTSRQQSMGSVVTSVSYGYDSAGRLATLTLPSGHFVQYGYTNGKVTSLTLDGSTTILNTVLYEPFGPTSGWTWGNGTYAVRIHDQDGNISQIDSGGEFYSYSLDNAFRITGLTNGSNSALSWSYGYDVLDRLTSANSSSTTLGWSFDANGNRLSQSGTNASTFSISSSSNRLSSVSGALTRTYSYDASGNPTSDGTRTFVYNDAGRMVSVTSGGVTTNYLYNALGQRVKKSNANGTTYFVYDEAGHLLSEFDGSGNLTSELIWMGDIPVAVLRPHAGGGIDLYYVHTDHLNAPIKITRPSDNAIVWRLDRDPYETVAANENPSGLGTFKFNLRFPGQYYDEEKGSAYNFYRDCYDPATGRYCQPDPIGLAGGLNPYVYVENNPISNVDPFGLAPNIKLPKLPKRPKLTKDQCKMDCQALYQSLIRACQATGPHFFACKAEIDQLIVECMVNGKPPAPECQDQPQMCEKKED